LALESNPKVEAIFNASSFAVNFPIALPRNIKDTSPARTQLMIFFVLSDMFLILICDDKAIYYLPIEGMLHQFEY
jgi:hypothetical protein